MATLERQLLLHSEPKLEDGRVEWSIFLHPNSLSKNGTSGELKMQIEGTVTSDVREMNL